MNIILGVDGKERPKSHSAAAALLRRLDFPHASIDVVHVLTRMPYKPAERDLALSGDALEAVQHASLEWAQGLVSQITNQLQTGATLLSGDTKSLTVKVLVRRSLSAAGGLLVQADKKKADLIAIDGPHQGEIGAFLTGSTARSLVIGSHEHSLLVAKDYEPAKLDARLRASYPKDFGIPSQYRSVRAVFATDHSPYANRCLEKLIQLGPRGISHLTVMTADKAGSSDAGSNRDSALAAQSSLIADNDGDLLKLAPLLEASGATGEARVIRGSTNASIAQAMEDAKADLLILGAHGHGLMERLTLGSVSFHQAMTAPYSLLILRA